MLVLSVYQDVPPPPLDPCRFVVAVWGAPHRHWQVLEMTDDEAEELWILLSERFQAPKPKRKKARR